jgi:hypothetical protein
MTITVTVTVTAGGPSLGWVPVTPGDGPGGGGASHFDRQ